MKKRRTVSLLVALVAALAHAESVGYWFVTSDVLTLTASSRASTLGGVVDVVTRPLMAGSQFTENALFYRPVASLTYTLDYALWGLDPTGYHLTNLLLHGTAVALTSLLVTELVNVETGGLAGLLVAAHPLTAELVPAASRRHGILMTVFLLTALLLLVRGRRRGSRRLLAGSAAAYALALLSKELSVLFVGLAFAWVALDELAAADSTRRGIAPALRAGVRHLVPFVFVSAAYLVARVAVLDGLGGYRQHRPLTPSIAFEIVTKYVVSVAYPQDVVPALFRAVGAEPLRALGGLLAVFALLLFGLAVARPRYRAGALALAVTGGGVGSLPFAAALLDRRGVDIVVGYQTPRPIAVGVLFVASLAAGAFVALLVLGRRRFARSEWRSFAFFALWFAAPVPLFLLSGEYTVRNGYFFLVPAMGLVALASTAAVRALVADAREPDAGAALTVITTVFVASLLVTTPLAHQYGGWHTTGETNRAMLTAVEGALVDTPPDADVRVSRVAGGVRPQKEAFPRVQSPSYTMDWTIESWLRLRDPGDRTTVRIDSIVRLPRAPTGATAATERRNGTTWVELRYTG